ncbi:MAG: response regulator [Desulfamplus sp.]|nr:response regulator [Desulfamplus sp.]
MTDKQTDRQIDRQTDRQLDKILLSQGYAPIKPVLNRLMIPLTAVLLILVCIFIAVLIKQQQTNLNLSINNIFDEVSGDITTLVDAQSRNLNALGLTLMQDIDLRVSLKAKERERLLAEYSDLFAKLRDSHGLTHLYFIGSDRICLLRVHKPDKHGDLIDRLTMQEAERTGRASTGLELGPLGTFTLRSVQPVFHDNELIGYIELGKEIEDIFNTLHKKDAIEIALSIRKNALDRSAWESGMRMLGREADWNRFEDDVLIYFSMPQFPVQAEKFVSEEDHPHDDDVVEITFNDKLWRVMAIRMDDISGTEVGDLILLINITAAKATHKRMLIMVSLVTTLLLGGLLFSLYILLKRIDRSILIQQIELAKAYTDMEERVKERTAELSITNAVLKNEIAENEQAAREKEKLQIQLNHSQKMESVGRLAGGIAHDFNNMLGVIIGHTELALMDIEPQNPLFDRIKEIRKAAERSSDLTRQLLAFARKQTVEPKILNLNETVEGMLNMLKRLIGEDITLKWIPVADPWPVKFDPSQIDHIIVNLCVNARDAISNSGNIIIETTKITLDATCLTNHVKFCPGDYMLLSVSDDGCGMDKETLAKLFEPFFTTKELGKGTGLGLATVYGIVEQNNGIITVYSEPGKGTTFRVYFPRHMGEHEQMIEAVEAQHAQRGHETILVVEDEDSMLEMTTIMLGHLGYTVLAAATYKEAIDLSNKYPGKIDLLITDVIMPQMNGRELANEILSRHSNIKSLFMSGYTADIITHHGVLDDGVNFIQKPFNLQSLSTKVRETLEK